MLIQRSTGRESKNSREIISGERSLGDISIEFLEAAVERMFNADEGSRVADLTKVKELRHRIVHLFPYPNDSGRNHWD